MKRSPSPPEDTVSHTLNLDCTHFAHTCACFDTIIPITKWRRPPRALKSHTLSIFHTNGAYSHWNSLPFGIHNMHQTLLKLARVAPPTHVVFDGEMEALFWYLQCFHLTRTARAPRAADFWRAVQCFGSQMLQIRCRCELAQPDDIMGL